MSDRVKPPVSEGDSRPMVVTPCCFARRSKLANICSVAVRLLVFVLGHELLACKPTGSGQDNPGGRLDGVLPVAPPDCTPGGEVWAKGGPASKTNRSKYRITRPSPSTLGAKYPIWRQTQLCERCRHWKASALFDGAAPISGLRCNGGEACPRKEARAGYFFTGTKDDRAASVASHGNTCRPAASGGTFPFRHNRLADRAPASPLRRHRFCSPYPPAPRRGGGRWYRPIPPSRRNPRGRHIRQVSGTTGSRRQLFHETNYQN
jgi:hypothetical protein